MEHIVNYTIIAETSNDYKIGTTDDDIFISMIGNNEKTCTSWLKLDNTFRDDFELGKTDKFYVNATDVGLPDAIRLKLQIKKDSDGWFCNSVTVHHPTLGEVFFGVYDVVKDEISVRAGPASLPQRETSLMYRDMRRLEINRNKTMYDWHLLPAQDQLGWNLPRFCKAESFENLPLLLQNNDVHYDNFKGNREKVLLTLLVEHVSEKFYKNAFQSYEDFNTNFHLHLLPSETPTFYNEWEKDEELGRQMLSGVNPNVITRCRELPEEFVKDEERIFGGKQTCAKKLEAKHLSWINYRGVFDGLKRNKSKGGEQLYCTDSICLFLVGSDKQLRPIAIQLEKDGYVFTPKDQEHDWMLAKMYFRNSDANFHEFVGHLFFTHIVIEPIGVALFQCLSRNHPVYKLLRPHLQTVAAINTLGRTFLIGPDAAANFTLSINGLDLTRYAFDNLRFEDLFIPNTFQRRGTEDAEALPHYNYREDSLRLWDAIERYASNVIQYYYKSDVDVVEDPELCDYIRAVAEEGIGWNGKGTKGFPVKLDTVKELVQYCTMVIFTSSVQHAASNFGQYEIYKFCPNAPAGMRLPPHKKGEGSMKRILDSLPDPIMAVLQAGISHTLSSFAPNEVFLGNYPLQLYTELEIIAMQEDFRRDLREISKAIHKRNKDLNIPYVYLLPERIPSSIAV